MAYGPVIGAPGKRILPSDTTPAMDGAATIGTSENYARADHVHPTDSSRAAEGHTHTKSDITDFPTSMPASDVSAWAKATTKPTYTASEVGADASGSAATVQGNLNTHAADTTAHITAAERTAWNGKTTNNPYTSNPAKDGTASPGTSANYARGDHVHPTDDSRAPKSHASTGTAYGAGNASNYGHVKLSDATNSTSGTSSGVAATPAAVKAAYDLADSHTHAAGDINSGTLDAARIPSLAASKIGSGTLSSDRLPTVPVSKGGSGLTASPSLLINLGSTTAANVMQASPRPGVTGTLPVGNGGTGATSAAAARTSLDVYAKGEVDAIAWISGVPEMHRMIFRGKNLGAALTAEQKTAIQNGSFDDLFLGDYWVINGINWRIVDFDYWLGCGDQESGFAKHHVVVMPDRNLGGNKQMNTSNTTEGGYVGSLMYTQNMADAKTACTNAFGANILTHRENLVNAVANGMPSASSWYNSSIELPSETMMYGYPYYSPTNNGTTIPTLYTINKTQFALFAVAPKFITTRQHYWLRDVVSSSNFAFVHSGGGAGCNYASNTDLGVRPVFPVGVA